MKCFLSNMKLDVLMPIALMLVTACVNRQDRIAELTAQKISLDKSIERLKYMRDSTTWAQINQDKIASFGASNRNALDSLQTENLKLVNNAHSKYVNRVYKNHRLKHYFKPDEIKQIRAWFADMGTCAPVKDVTGEMPMFYLTYLFDLDTDASANFSTPFRPDFMAGNVVYLDKNTATKLGKLEQQILNHDIYVAEANLSEETKKCYDAECKKIIAKRNALVQKINNKQFKNATGYKNARATIKQCEKDLWAVLNKYYVKDVVTGNFVARSVVAMREKNKGEKIYCFEYLNFAIPEYAAIKKQMLRNNERVIKLANANERADIIERKVVSHYNTKIRPLSEKRDSIKKLIKKLNAKTR